MLPNIPLLLVPTQNTYTNTYTQRRASCTVNLRMHNAKKDAGNIDPIEQCIGSTQEYLFLKRAWDNWVPPPPQQTTSNFVNLPEAQ